MRNTARSFNRDGNYPDYDEQDETILFKLLIYGFVPLSSPFVLVDAQGNCIAVTVYNIAAGRGVSAGDSVAIPEPYVQVTKVAISDDEV